MSLQAAAPPQPGGVAPVGTDGAHLCLTGHILRLDAPSVPVRPAAVRQGSPASAMEHHTCWLSGTGKPMQDVAGIQTGSLWAQSRRCTGSCKTSASWAWCTIGKPHQIVALGIIEAPHSHLAIVCVPATPWLCNAQREPEGASLWDPRLNGVLKPHDVTSQSTQEVCWKSPDGRQWHQRVHQVVNSVRRHEAKRNA